MVVLKLVKIKSINKKNKHYFNIKSFIRFKRPYKKMSYNRYVKKNIIQIIHEPSFCDENLLKKYFRTFDRQ